MRSSTPIRCSKRACGSTGRGAGAEGSHILIAVARYLAAHSPTERAQLQTADVARRLTRGQSLHEASEQPG
jgi:hypothetical protein